ncbi:hypothetical protein ELH93_29115 (plasmid) [Rhizobium leguminosarum]|uniref:hypothetical protein n=1 Tax=Rhizobium leguminosarum TaxID=384 RepID=UPI001031C541|nr:hypothetical protein [Rhizobium leguminosarum]TAY27786.1 hypothetical protein ELH93_29115 [Rhizobium leguminosarum]
MTEKFYPNEILLCELIDRGYSKHFAVQLEIPGNIEDIDFVAFDERDRELWGRTPMRADAAVAHTENGAGIRGYSSDRITPHFRLICVADNEGVAFNILSDPDRLLEITIGRVAKMIGQTSKVQ